jgi:hypothetical protein
VPRFAGRGCHPAARLGQVKATKEGPAQRPVLLHSWAVVAQRDPRVGGSLLFVR